MVMEKIITKTSVSQYKINPTFSPFAPTSEKQAFFSLSRWHIKDLHQGYFPPGWNRSGCHTQISTHSTSDTWKAKSLLKPLHTESFTCWRPLHKKSRESPIDWGPDVPKVPSMATPAGPIWKLHTNPKVCFAFSYLKVASTAVVEGLEELIWPGEVYKLLDCFLPPPETNMKWF